VAKRLLRREHIVAASLVGSVVVVVGFASGLGTRPGTEAGGDAAREPGGDTPVVTAPPVTTAPPPTRGDPTTIGGRGPGVVPVTTAPAPPPGTNHTAHPTATPKPTTKPTMSTTSPPPATTTPPAPCQPGLVPEALDTLLATLGRATDALGLLAAGPTSTPVPPVALGLPEGTPLDQFLATCPATPATQPPPATPPPPTTTTPTGHG
jgi:hypothetical protein